MSIIQLLCSDLKSRVICGHYLSEEFEVNTGVKQGCILSPLLFTLSIDWLMWETMQGRPKGIKWTFTEILEDLDFADDFVLLSHRFNDIQRKSEDLARNARPIGLEVNSTKTKSLRTNCSTTEPITINGTDIEEVAEFTYLGTNLKVTIDGDSEIEVKMRIRKSRGAFTSLKSIWKSSSIRLKTKVRIFKSNVLSVLLCGVESWKVTKSVCQKLDVFQNKCLRRILGIYWPNKISNCELRKKTCVRPVSLEVKQRRLRWSGHICRIPFIAIPRVAMRWTPDGKRKRGRPKETWRRSVEREMKEKAWSSREVVKLAKDKQQFTANRKLRFEVCALALAVVIASAFSFK